MHHILEHPLNFQEQLMLAARKRWGLVLLGFLMISVLIQVLIFYFRGYVLLAFLENLPSLILNYFPSAWQSYLWENIGSKVIILADIKSLIEILWFNYSWYLISIPVLFIVMYRSESKTLGYRNKAPIKE
ncbi:MAG TPA: hypothetical protein VN370_04500 [Desulfitobacteriaceae bacterium]|nr:hypothetical protein [Desulfitobacteriaceae bacterium]